MPLDKLQKQILDDAKRKAEEIVSVAEKQAEAILKEARSQAEDAVKSGEEELNIESSRELEEQQENAELQKRALVLEARHKLLESLLPKLKSMVIKRVRADGYDKLLNTAIGEASSMLPQQELTLVIDKKDAGLVRNFSGKVQYGNVGNGFELRNKDGSVKAVVTIEGLLEQRKSEIEMLLIEELFSSREQPKPVRAKKVRVKRQRRGKRR